KSLNEEEKSLNEEEKSLNEEEKSLNEEEKSLNGGLKPAWLSVFFHLQHTIHTITYYTEKTYF
ncbi:hypothetical protein ACM0P9_10145, partial [Streptococcus pluranimalium]